MLSAKLCSRIVTGVFRQSRLLSSAAEAVAEGVPTTEGPSSTVPSNDDRKIAPHILSLVDTIANLPLLEVSDLNYALKKKLNLPDAPVMPAGMLMQAAGAAPAAAAETKDDDIPQKMTFAVKLTKFDDTKKIALIKEIRNQLPNLNLVQAKKFVETAPVEVKGDLGKAEADELKAALEKVGATVELA